MSGKLVRVTFILGLQACLVMLFPQATSIHEESRPGVLQRAGETYWAAKAKVQSFGGEFLDFVEMYYEDHIKPVTDPYINWANNKTSSLWGGVKDRLSSYRPM